MQTDGNRIYGVNHDTKQVMRIGHTSWGGVGIEDMKERLAIYAPRTEKGIAQFNYIVERFNPSELLPEDKAMALGYERVRGYWDGGAS